VVDKSEYFKKIKGKPEGQRRDIEKRSGSALNQAFAVSRVLAVVRLTEERRRAFLSPDDVGRGGAGSSRM
jgi:hypothetical protein